MTEDKEFFIKWQNSMTSLIMKGCKIIIIHNINRNTEEMIQAMTGWLPLYRTGMVEPHYFKKSQRTDSFSHTLFINPNGYAVTSTSINSKTDRNIYHFHSNSEEIELLCNNYRDMLDNSLPLIEITNEVPKECVDNKYQFEGVTILLSKDVVYVTNVETGEIIGFKHPTMIKAFFDFCNEL